MLSAVYSCGSVVRPSLCPFVTLLCPFNSFRQSLKNYHLATEALGDSFEFIMHYIKTSIYLSIYLSVVSYRNSILIIIIILFSVIEYLHEIPTVNSTFIITLFVHNKQVQRTQL